VVIGTEMAPMLTVREVAKILHVHPNTVRRWSDRGMIGAVRITCRGDRRFQRQDVSAFLAELHRHNGNQKEALRASG
jgi:excisionase family DNA binding protein